MVYNVNSTVPVPVTLTKFNETRTNERTNVDVVLFRRHSSGGYIQQETLYLLRCQSVPQPPPVLLSMYVLGSGELQ